MAFGTNNRYPDSNVWYDEENVTDVIVPKDFSNFQFDQNKNVRTITVSKGINVFDPDWFYYVKNLEWIEFQDEMEILNENCTFPGCKKLEYVVCNPNVPLSKLPAKWKQWLAIGVLKHIGDGNSVEEEAYKEVRKYISGQNKKKQLYKLGYKYPFVVKFLVKEKLLSEELYDEMIAQCQNDNNVEVLTLLMEGRQAQYPAEEMFEREEKKIEKEIKDEEKMQDQHSTAYLKSRWSWKKREDGTYVLWTYKGEETEVTVPSRVGKNLVSAIRGHAFMANSSERNNWIQCNVNKIIIEEGITEIGAIEMSGTSGPLLEYRVPIEIHIPATVTSISHDAFTSYGVWNEKTRRRETKVVNVKLYAPKGSYAEKFAKKHRIPFEVEEEMGSYPGVHRRG